MNKDCLVIVFAKAPVPGFAKTRLAPLLGNDGAARLASKMLAHTLDVALAAALGPVELCCAPDMTHADFERAGRRPGVALSSQGDGDLGERMLRAIERGLSRHRGVIVIGTDAPQLDAGALRSAAHALLSHDAAIAPASDGGYVLIGLSRSAPALFADIAWSTSRVMAQTRNRAARIGITLHELPSFHDVDEPCDLVHLPEGWLA
jgi:rSAM/selenodomain-associated transferase 1